VAGDWIKMRNNLWDDPRVSNICDLTGSSEAAVIGALYWLWAAADEHTESGYMPGLTATGIDRKTGVPGFAAALLTIGWLTQDADGLTIHNFEEHNGSSAKKRCADAQRKANVRATTDKTRTTGGQTRTDSGQKEPNRGAREEKRREEIPLPNGRGGQAADDKKAKTPAERRKSELWANMKTFLVDSGECKDLKAAGAVITATIREFDEATSLAGIEATLHKRPAAAIAYLKAACQQATGARLNKQEELEAGNLAAAQRFAESINATH
jgi:hypothetical protein